MKQNNKGNWLLWVLLIFLPPFGIIYIWIAKREFTLQRKTILTIIFGIWFLFCMVAGNNIDELDNIQTVQTTVSPKVSSENNFDTKPTNEPIESATPIHNTKKPVTKPSETPEPTPKSDLTSFQLISMERHPVLYDYLSDAHDFWDDYAKERIVFPDDVYSNFESGKTVLVIDAYPARLGSFDYENSTINSFEIYPNKKISLKKGLELTKSYLPIELMKKWYTLEYCDRYHFEDDKAGVYYYSALYVPTKKGKKAIKKSKIKYNYVSILIYVENNKVLNIQIETVYNTPHWRTGVELETKKWSYDFLK